MQIVQYFNDKQFEPSFTDNQMPHLMFSCKTSEQLTSMPRLMHRHDAHAEIVFIQSGRGTHRIGNKTYQTHKGDLLVYNQGVLHDEIADPGESLIVYCIAVSNLHLVGREENHIVPDGIDAVIPTDEFYEDTLALFKMIHNLTVENTQSSMNICSYLVQGLLASINNIIRGFEPHSETHDEALEKAIKEYIDEHFTQDITLDILADEFHLSKYYIARLFKDSHSFSPIHYVIRRRIGAAQNLLINTNLSVTDIAYQIGYNNSNHFHTAFLKAVGMTPQAYREDSVSPSK